MTECAHNGCTDVCHAKGFCKFHYKRNKRGYDMSAPRWHDNRTKHPLFYTFRNMHRRCENKKECNYKNYGGRGIGVCGEWSGKQGFWNFVEAMGDKPSKMHTLDRIDNEGDYGPHNCKWSTYKEQANNRRKRSVSK